MSQLEQHAEPDFGTGKKTLKIYIAGLVACVILTLVPFATVMYHLAGKTATYYILGIAAIVQFLVQVLCFLRLNMRTQQSRMNVYAFFFSVVVLLTIVGGSLWIMWHLNYNMMH